jgi:hypothetical protein
LSPESEGCCEEPVGVLRLRDGEVFTFLDCDWVLRASIGLSTEVRCIGIGGDLGALGGYWDESTEGEPDVGFGYVEDGLVGVSGTLKAFGDVCPAFFPSISPPRWSTSRSYCGSDC